MFGWLSSLLGDSNERELKKEEQQDGKEVGMSQGKTEVVCPICGETNRALLTVVPEGQAYPKLSCAHRIADPVLFPDLALACAEMAPVDLPPTDESILKEHGEEIEALIREHLHEQDGWFFGTYDEREKMGVALVFYLLRQAVIRPLDVSLRTLLAIARQGRYEEFRELKEAYLTFLEEQALTSLRQLPPKKLEEAAEYLASLVSAEEWRETWGITATKTLRSDLSAAAKEKTPSIPWKQLK